MGRYWGDDCKKDLKLADRHESLKTNLDRLLLSFKDTHYSPYLWQRDTDSLLDRPGEKYRMLPGG